MTTKHVVADDALGKVAKRFWEVMRRVMEGTLDPDAVADSLQLIAEGKEVLPTTMTIGDRTYEILGFLEGDEQSVPGQTMVERAKKMHANLGQDDGRYLLDHQDEIPAALRGKIAFVLTDWRNPDDTGDVAYVDWRGSRWLQGWLWLGHDWYSNAQVLRRKLSA